MQKDEYVKIQGVMTKITKNTKKSTENTSTEEEHYNTEGVEDVVSKTTPSVFRARTRHMQVVL